MKFLARTKASRTAAIALALAMMTTAGFYACKKPTEGINLIVSTGTLAKSPVLVHFRNANPSATNQPGDFNVTITGRDSALVVLDGGSSKFTVSHGFLPLSLRSAAKPTKAAPIIFNVTASVNGYAPVTKTVHVTGDATQVIEIDLVEYANPTAGTLSLSRTTALTGGTSAAVELTTTPSGTTTKTATLSIPAGTQMLDAAGNVINASSLKSNVVQFSSGVASIINAFPGGLRADLVRGPNGALVPGGVNFVTAGMLAIDMTADNTPVKGFSKPVTMSVQLQSDLNNFYTGNPVAVGDTIPMWSYNEKNGEWKREGVANIVSENGQLVAKTTITHLSYWNIDFMYYGDYYVSKNPLAINLTPSTGANWTGQYYIQLQTADGNYLTGWSYYRPEYDFYQQFTISAYSYNYYGYTYSSFSQTSQTVTGKFGIGAPSLPKAARAKIVVYDEKKGYTKVGESAIFNTETAGSVNVSVTPPPPPDYVKVYFSVSSKCTTKNITTSPSGWYYLYDVTAAQAGEYAYTYFYLSNGVIYNYSYNDQTTIGATANGVGGTTRMVNGHQYQLQTYYNNAWMSTSFTFTKANFTLPPTNGLSGSSKYDAATNTLTVTAAFDVNCK